MNSAVSFSNRSAASVTDLFMRAEAAPTLRLKSFIQVPRTFERENYHALLANARLRHYFVLRSRGQPQASPGYTPRYRIDVELHSNLEIRCCAAGPGCKYSVHVFILGRAHMSGRADCNLLAREFAGLRDQSVRT